MLIYLVCWTALLDNLIDQARYEFEVFRITWLRWSAYRNRFNWGVVEPIKAWLFLHDYIAEKPLILVVKELNEKIQDQTDRCNQNSRNRDDAGRE